MGSRFFYLPHFYIKVFFFLFLEHFLLFIHPINYTVAQCGSKTYVRQTAILYVKFTHLCMSMWYFLIYRKKKYLRIIDPSIIYCIFSSKTPTQHWVQDLLSLLYPHKKMYRELGMSAARRTFFRMWNWMNSWLFGNSVCVFFFYLSTAAINTFLRIKTKYIGEKSIGKCLLWEKEFNYIHVKNDALLSTHFLYSIGWHICRYVYKRELCKHVCVFVTRLKMVWVRKNSVDEMG